jgi:chorismate dehydratase
LRIGCVKYLNARPLIHGWPDSVILDHPSALCRNLAAGELDAALVSSFEFLRNPVYQIVDGVSISSDGPVYSVVVAHQGEPQSAGVELDPASQTSVALLQYLVRQSGSRFCPEPLTGDALAPLADGKGRLLIGDQAIRFRERFGDQYEYRDLGQEWKKLTGLPFVYALWLVRPEVKEAGSLAAQLRSVRDDNLRGIDRIIAAEREFDHAFCARYYAENLRFTFGDREKQGLSQFAAVCQNLDLVPKHQLSLRLV